MKIGIDARCLEWSRGGVARYLTNMLKLWPTMTSAHRFVLYFQNEIPPDDFLKNPMYESRLLRGPRWLRTRRVLAEQILMRKQIVEDDLDLYYAIWYSAPLKLPVKTVIGAWDISYSTHPEQYSIATRISLGYFSRRSCEDAAGVVTCSDFDARQIEKYYHVPAQQICTYYLAADDRFTPDRDEARLAAVRAKYGLPQRFVLSLGVIHNRRNVDVIIQAFERIKDEVADIALVVIGQNLTQQPRRDIDGLMAPLIAARRAVRIPWIDDEDLVELYRASSLFVITSTVDGETLLLKEAMKCGVPVLTSSLLEGTIGGNGYIIEDPESVESTAAALRRALLDDEAAREDLIRRGIEWNRQFSWEKVARKSLQFLEATGNS